MAGKQIIEGSWVLETGVEDADSYYESHKNSIDAVIAWANNNGIYVGFGTSDNGTYLCEYRVSCITKQLCKGYVAELKSLLKRSWKGLTLGYQQTGVKMW
ncbi:MAG: hypothetical protein PHR82_07810 [Endomicrobiaceae bacterium]|nr:hypothetical protein [Endomicrobiaceae bacterium]